MDFVAFCRAHGIIIDRIPPMGKWVRFPTVDKPRHRNGSVKFMGSRGYCQNHATELEVSVWFPDEPIKIDRSRLVELARRAEEDTLKRQEEASKKAAWILHQCKFTTHEYLKRKGFPEEYGNVWVKEDGDLLVVPMRIGRLLAGVQLIDKDGNKRFLSGQKTSEAEFVFDNKGPHILCEGLATAMSLRLILKNYKRRYTIHVTFSAGNMQRIASKLPGGFVVADNDKSGTGERVAKEIGWPYWISDQLGDCNDHHLREGIFRTGQSVLRALKI